MTKTIMFTKKRETKGTWLFEETVANGDVESIGTLYVKKHALQAMGWPQSLRITVEGLDHPATAS